MGALAHCARPADRGRGVGVERLRVSERKKPAEMSPEELKAFVQRALKDARKRPPPPDLVKWYEASGRITDKDLRRVLR